jgi:hypothetical protein
MGYRFANGNLEDLTYNQEILVARIAEEKIKYDVRLAGGEVNDSPRRSKRALRRKKDTEDWYGQQLEFKKRLEESAKEFVDYSDCMKPL